MEGFDEALDRTVWSLSDQRLKSDRDIADKRRNKPKEIEALFQNQFRDQELLDEKEMAHPKEDIDGEDVDMDGMCQY